MADEYSPLTRPSIFPCRITTYDLKICSLIMVFAILLMSSFTVIYLIAYGKPQKVNIPDGLPQCPTKHEKLPALFDCYPESLNSTGKHACARRGCCYIHDMADDEFPKSKCIYSKNYGYKVTGTKSKTTGGFEIFLERLNLPSRYFRDFEEARIFIEDDNPYRLRIKIYDPLKERYEVPFPVINKPVDKHQNFMYNVKYDPHKVPFSIKVQRSSTGTTIFDSSVGGLTLSHQFLEISTTLPTGNIFGLNGHTQKQFTRYLKNRSWVLFSSSRYMDGGSVHPFYMCIENDGSAHGVLLLNSNAIEVRLYSKPAITFRALGGILDFYIFFGPTPNDVIRQYTEAIGRPVLPPYWSLGLHHYCFPKDLSNDSIPMDVLHHRQLSNLENRTNDLKIVASLKPTISTSIDLFNKSMIKKSRFLIYKWNNEPALGQIDNDTVAYIDFGSSLGAHQWSFILGSYKKYDAFSLEDNEPLNHTGNTPFNCLLDEVNRPHYIPGAPEMLNSMTLCLDTMQHLANLKPYSQYDVHNLYGYTMLQATYKACGKLLRGKRLLFTSKSTFVGSGQYGGHWINGLELSWGNMEAAIAAVTDYNLYGMPIVGIRMCSCGAENEELVLHWLQLTMFFPLVMLKECDHHLSSLNKNFRTLVLRSTARRYELLPYLYTLFYFAQKKGDAVLRTLAYEFPNDPNAVSVRHQFMWGSSILISPVLQKGVSFLKYYLPNGTWYLLHKGTDEVSKSEWFKQNVTRIRGLNPLIHIRAGHIVVQQEASDNALKSRLKTLTLIAALNSTLEAEGTLFWDDGISQNSIKKGDYVMATFTVSKNILTVVAEKGDKNSRYNVESAYISRVLIWGMTINPKRAMIENIILKEDQWHFDSAKKVLEMKDFVIRLQNMTKVEWFTEELI